MWLLAWMLVCLTVGFIGAVAATAEARQHSVDAAADLVSLSAAATLQRGGDACSTAASVAAANAVVLARCVVRGEDVVVVVRAHVRLPFGLHPVATGMARAGP